MCQRLMDSPLVYGLIVVSGFCGAIISFLVYLFLVQVTGTTLKLTMDREWWYTGFWTGVFERIFFTSIIGLLGLSGSGIATASIAWIAVKVQAHYNIFTKEDEKKKADMPRVYLGLLGSLASLLLAVLGGYFWDGGFALSHPWAATPKHV